MKAVIVGGGIGGLASAVALRNRGCEVEVLEQSHELTEVGAGLSVWPNALRALDVLGLGDRVREHALADQAAGIRTDRGRWLSRTDTSALESRFGLAAMVHRAALLEILRAALPDDALRPGVRVQAVDETGTVSHSAGESRGDVVVGADGLRSVVRTTLWPDAEPPRYAGYAAWRMVTRTPVEVDAPGETWGRGDRFGFALLVDGRVYCFAVTNTPEGGDGGGLSEVRARFGHWHEPIPSLLAAVGDDDVLHNDIFDLPPIDTFVRGRVVLVGDAAHAMTPNMGQGACQALEDAVVLAECLADDDLASYDERRRRRTQKIVQQSARIGRLAQLQSPVAVVLRNALMRATPSSALMRSLAPVLSWSPDDR
jgi:2-polyprenyl-6-methoxyphenol hydroxylase-like FAD-dependent oxidoreductase